MSRQLLVHVESQTLDVQTFVVTATSEQIAFLRDLEQRLAGLPATLLMRSLREQVPDYRHESCMSLIRSLTRAARAREQAASTPPIAATELTPEEQRRLLAQEITLQARTLLTRLMIPILDHLAPLQSASPQSSSHRDYMREIAEAYTVSVLARRPEELPEIDAPITTTEGTLRRSPLTAHLFARTPLDAQHLLDRRDVMLQQRQQRIQRLRATRRRRAARLQPLNLIDHDRDRLFQQHFHPVPSSGLDSGLLMPDGPIHFSMMSPPMVARGLPVLDPVRPMAFRQRYGGLYTPESPPPPPPYEPPPAYQSPTFPPPVPHPYGNVEGDEDELTRRYASYHAGRFN